jgi:hypothetical protein
MSVVLPIEEDPRFRISTATGGETSYSVPFPFQANADIVVLRERDDVETELEEGTDYSLSGAESPAGGTVTLLTAAVAGDRYTRVGRTVLDRLQSVTRNGSFKSKAIDDDIDRFILIAQEMRRDIGQSWRSPLGTNGGSITPGVAHQTLAFDENGDLVPSNALGLLRRGPWQDAPTAYVTNDLVTKNGSSYAAKRNNTGKDPATSPDDWDIFAEGGGPADGTVIPPTISPVPQDWIGGARVNRLLRHSFYDDLNSAWYCAGSGDETEGVTDFIAALANGGQGALATLTHNTASQIVIDKPIRLHGSAGSILRSTSLTANGLKITSTEPCLIEGFRLQHDGGKTAGNGILVDPPSTGQNVRTTIRDMLIANFPTSIYLNDAALATIEENYLANWTNAGIVNDNVASPDNGDTEIKGNTIDTGLLLGGGDTGSGILMYRSGGLRVTSNKIMRGKTAFRLIPTGLVGTSILLFNTNSCEHQTVAGFKAEAGDIDFIKTDVSHNHFNGQQISPNPVFGEVGAATPTAIAIGGSSGSKFREVIVDDNNIAIGLSGGVGIELEHVANLNLGVNTITGSTGASRVGVSIGANVTGLVMPQVMDGLTTEWSIDGAASLDKIRKTKTGTVTVTTNTPAGTGLFTGPGVAVVFARPFHEVPFVMLQAQGGSNGEVGGRAVSASKTGFTAYALGHTNSASMSLGWVAFGL